MTEPIEPAPLGEESATWSQEPAVEPAGEEPTAEDDVSDDELDPRTRAAMQKLRRENQNLRTRLHESEEMVAGAAARATVHHKAVIEAAAAAAGFIDPTDFTLAHPDPSPFLDEQFETIVGDRVAEAAEALLEAKPHLRRPVGAPPSQRPVEGLRPGASPEPRKAEVTWSSALRGR